MIMEFLQQNWIVIVSLIVALLGGVPGVVGTVKYFRERPRFRISVPAVLDGTLDSDTRRIGFVALVVDLTTLGAQALAPNGFGLEWQSERSWETLTHIMSDLPFQKMEGDFRFEEEPGPNLVRYRRLIAPNDTVRGYLWFMTNPNPPALISKGKIRLTASDSLGRQYRVKMPGKGMAAIEPGRTHPGLAITRAGAPDVPPLKE